MLFKGGKAKSKPAPAERGRVPLNYYRSGAAKPAASPFVKKIPKVSKTRKYFIRGLDVVALTIILCIVAYSLVIQPRPKFSVNDTTYHSMNDYQAAVIKELKKLKNRNKVSFDEQDLVNSLKKQFPEVSSVSVELPLFSEQPIVSLSIAQPSFFLAAKGLDYVIDSQGVATASAKSLPQVKNLTTLSDQSGFDTRLGQQVLSAQNVSFINTILAQAAHAKVPVNSLILPPEAQELDLKTADRPYYIKFYMGGDPLLATGQWLAARHNFDQTSQQPSQYLDVRVPGKIFYK